MPNHSKTKCSGYGWGWYREGCEGLVSFFCWPVGFKVCAFLGTIAPHGLLISL